MSCCCQFLGVGSTAVPRTYESALRDRKPAVTDYGVGAHGFKGAMDRALTAIAAEFGNGSSLLIPAGDWTVEETIVIDQSGVALEGAGHSSTRILNAQTDAPAIQLGAVGTWRTSASNLVFGAAAGVTSVAGSCGLLVKGSDIRLTSIEAYAYPNPLHNGVVVEGAYLVTIDRVLTSGLLNFGQLYRDVASLTFLEAQSLACAYGFGFEGVEGIWGINVHAYGNAGYGFRFATHTSRENINNFMFGWIGDTSGDHNWFVTDLKNSTLVGCWGATQLNAGGNTGANGFLLASNKVRNLQFIGGRAGNNNGNGVTLFNNGTAPQDLYFDGFDFGANVAGLASNGRGGAGSGLGADAACTGIRVRGGQNKGNPSGAFSSTGIELIDNVSGYVNAKRGTVSGTTNASGNITFNHGMNETPVAVQFIFGGTYALTAQATSLGATSITARVFGPNGAAIVSSPISFVYIAAGARAGA